MIKNCEDLATTSREETVLACIEAGIEAAHPSQVVADSVEVTETELGTRDRKFDLNEVNNIFVVGGGNGAGSIAEELENVLDGRIAGGKVVSDFDADTDTVEVLLGDHPFPSTRGIENTRSMLRLAEQAEKDDLILTILVGGGSALMAAPVSEISIDDLQALTESLLKSGATIHEINSVRKHVSVLKGGKLARHIAPARTVGLVFSDVAGDDPSVVASGPTSPDDSTFQDALEVLDRYGIDTPTAVETYLRKGRSGEADETPDSDTAVFDRVTNCVVANNLTALAGAADVAREHGYRPLILSSRIRGEAREAAKAHIGIVEEIAATGHPVEPPAIVLSGGETTVTVRGNGSGGPNLEFAVAAAINLETTKSTLGTVDTDGYDGSTDVAGALVDDEAVDPGAGRDALEANDTYPVLDKANSLIRTGATGTNVNDLRVFAVGSPDQ